MPDSRTQQKAFQFLPRHFQSQDLFTKADLRAAVPEWSNSSLNTYWSKQIKRLLAPAGRGKFRVSEAFRPYSNWQSFKKNIASQVRRIYSDYTSLTYDNLIIYEFYMPLTNEGHLRTALDALFYKDTILGRLKTIGHETVLKHFPIQSEESESAYLNRVCEWISSQFGGYSISHVNGRFRANDLATMNDVAEIQKVGEKYLIDETTAVVRFIFPCGGAIRRKTPISGADFEDEEYRTYDSEPDDASIIRWFFRVLFVQSILQVVNGEDEIWMVESGMRTRLHIWRIEDD